MPIQPGVIDECHRSEMARAAADWRVLNNGAQVHRSAIVMPAAELGDGVVVHPYAIVGRIADRSAALARQPAQARSVYVGPNTVIGCHAVVYGDVEIGADCLIGDHALIREGAVIGNRCVVGCHVSISYDSEISDDCRFQNGTVFHGACGPGCFFGVGVVCSSDRRIDLKDYRHSGVTMPIFGKRVMVGSGANILAGVRVGDDAVIGAGAIVTKDVPGAAVMLGPAASIRHHPV